MASQNSVLQTLIVGKSGGDAERQAGGKNQREGLNNEPNQPTQTIKS